jgi:viroplasmin and RNaseH domain-containing protein
MKTAWLVKVDYKVPAMRGFSSYESALKYYHEMVDKIEEQIEEQIEERNCEQIESYSSGKPLLTQFREWDEEYKYFTTLGLVSIKQIEWEEE